MKQILLAVTLLITLSTLGQTTQVGKTSYRIDRLVQRYHYESKPLDDSLSYYVFHEFIDVIDPSGYYFLKEDIELLKKYEFEIDDQIKESSSVFFDELADIYYKRSLAADSLVDELMSTPFNFEVKENLVYENNEVSFLEDYPALKERWRLWLKSSILEELFDGDYLENPVTAPLDSLMLMLPEASKTVQDYEKFEISSYVNHPSGYKNYLATYYLDVIASYYDPHTTYFSNIDKEHFEASLSKDNYAFGFSLREDEKGQILIAGLTPGGSAWMSNAINQDDVILKVEFDKGRPVDVTQLRLDDLMLIFENTNSERLILTLKKANGRVEEVELLKSEIYVDDDVIKSVILQGDKKIGYITLPDFYTDWDQTTGLGCANDVAKNIVKLKQEDIDGLILDLRNNGGGSLKEAIDLAGIFIDAGPITIEQGKYREPKSIKDMNRGAIYLGPLVIMVNGLSASASEIFSAAMQDYNRAIIVGSKTYGKSTGQVVLPLDPTYSLALDNMDEVDESYGYLKLTRTKFYRVTKETHQKEGVVPDIALRDYYELYEYSEALNKMALEKDQVDKKVYYTPFAEFPVSKLQSNSNYRMGMNILYQQMCTVMDSINNFTAYYENSPLNLADYQENERIITELYDQLFTEELKVSEQFEVMNNKFDAEIMKINEYRAELNKDYLEIVSKDLYISEAYNVLVDYINSK